MIIKSVKFESQIYGISKYIWFLIINENTLPVLTLRKSLMVKTLSTKSNLIKFHIISKNFI